MIEKKEIPVLPNEIFDFRPEYKCPYCSEVFKSNYHLENHINLIHPIEHKNIRMKGGKT